MEDRPYRLISDDDIEVAGSRFAKKEHAENLAKGMNELRENWDNKTCKPPYRVQEIQEIIWKDI